MKIIDIIAVHIIALLLLSPVIVWLVSAIYECIRDFIIWISKRPADPGSTKEE